MKEDVGHNNEHVNALDEFLKRYTQEKSKIGKRSKNYKHFALFTRVIFKKLSETKLNQSYNFRKY